MTASYEQIIGGRYALYGPIASGGMAAVHFGRLMGTGGFARTVAIKRLKGEQLDRPELIATLLDEARLASRIRHPNVVPTLDMVAGEEEVFLVMDYVAGETLAALFATLQARRERLRPRLATGIMTGVLYGLHAAHEATNEGGEPLEIVHRDVSPQNVLVGADGLARLLDFGIAKGKGRLQTTRAGQLKGKVSYMSPEQILGEEPDRRSDVYAAAVVLWETLTGRRLFPGGESDADSYDVIPKILEADVEPPSVVAPGVPAALDAIVMRGLNRHREARWPTARAFAVALEDGLGVATARQIGDWVAELAAETLAEREARVRELEAQIPGGDRHSVNDIVDATVARRRRKKLSSRVDADEVGAAAGEETSDFNRTVPETRDLEDALTRARDIQRARDAETRVAARPKLSATKLQGGSSAEAKTRLERRSSGSAEAPTRLERRPSDAAEPPTPTPRGKAESRRRRDVELERRIDARDREQARAFRLAQAKAAERASLSGEEEVELPVQSHRGVVIALGLVLVVALIALIVNLL